MSTVLKQPSVLPGFGLTLGFTLFYLSLIVLIPLTGLFVKTSTLSWDQFWSAVADPRTVASYQLTFGASFLAALINAVFGVDHGLGPRAILVSRQEARGRARRSALCPSDGRCRNRADRHLFGQRMDRAVSGTAGDQSRLYTVGSSGSPDLYRLTLRGADCPTGAARSREGDRRGRRQLGANRWKTFTEVIFPEVLPALLTGFTLAFARAVGEYGSVVFISGNMPMRTEITPLLIITKLEQYDYAGATAIAVVMLVASFILLLLINGLQWWSGRRQEAF